MDETAFPVLGIHSTLMSNSDRTLSFPNNKIPFILTAESTPVVDQQPLSAAVHPDVSVVEPRLAMMSIR